MTEEILGFLQKNVVEYKRGIALSKLSTVKIGGMADFVVYPESEQKLVLLVEYLIKNQIKHIILGRMSNVLPKDAGYPGVIVKTDRIDEAKVDDCTVIASAGVSLPRLSKILAEASLSGLETLSGVPGSLGGAIRGNAGAYGREISDVISSVRIYDPLTGEIADIMPGELDFGYRHSAICNNFFIVLSAKLELAASDSGKIFSTMRAFAGKRRESQPVDKASLGSVFKRPGAEIYPWKLISDCGLRGYRIGDAQISEKHAGFIVNHGKATAEDYMAVVAYTKECVFRKSGIELECEFEVI